MSTISLTLVYDQYKVLGGETFFSFGISPVRCGNIFEEVPKVAGVF